MSSVVGLLLLLTAAWLLVKRYERFLDAQMGRWMASELNAQRSRSLLARDRADAGEL